MKHIKRSLAGFLSLLMILSLFSFGTLAGEDPAPETLTAGQEQMTQEEQESLALTQEAELQDVAEAPANGQEGLSEEEASADTQAPEEIAEEPEQAESEAEAAAPDAEEENVFTGTVVVQGEVSADPEIAGSNDELLTEYIDITLGTSNNAMYAAQPVGKRLAGTDLAAYTALKTWTGKVAKGEITNTITALTPKQLGLKTSYTAKDLGVASLGAKNEVSEEAVSALRNLLPDIYKVNLALLFDCPYEMYWYDKSIDGALTYVFSIDHKASKDGTVTSVSVPSVTYRFTVAGEYADKAKGTTAVDVDGKMLDRYYNLDKKQLGAVQTALKTIRQIVDANKSKSAYDKLKAYKDKIDELVEYHPTAMADPSTPYGNPWQLIWVFDGNPETKVVCEGYSKAFQYLCDLSTLGKVTVRTVTGTLYTGKSTESHMWNLVTMEDGKNYLVDVTNCDEGTAGYPDKLFLAGGGGSGTADYVIAGLAYTYAKDTKAMYREDELLLSRVYYGSAGPVPTAKEQLAFDKSGGNQIIKGTDRVVNLTLSNLNPDYAYPSITLNVGIFNKKTDKFDLLLEMGTDYQIVQTKDGFRLTLSCETIKKAFQTKGRKDNVVTLYAQLTDNDGKVLTKDLYSLSLLDKSYKKKVKQAKVKASGAKAEAEMQDAGILDALEKSDDMGIGEDSFFDDIDYDAIWEEILLQLPEEFPEDAEIELYAFFDVEALEMEKDERAGTASLVLDIEPRFEAVLADNESGEEIVLAEGSILFDEPVDMEIPVGDLFDGIADTSAIYIQHSHNGKQYVYTGTLKEEEDGDYVEFCNLNGFSQFTISNTDPAGTGRKGSVFPAKPSGSAVKTGDESHAGLWAALMAAALLTGAAAAAVLIRKRKAAASGSGRADRNE